MGERGRKSYNNIEELAQSIQDNGLIQPIVLEAKDGNLMEQGTEFMLVAGGRRLTALKHLGVETLTHAVSSTPGTYGYVLKTESAEFTSELSRLFVEIAENLDRENLDWRDEVALLVKAWKLAKREAAERGEIIIMRDFGATLGVGYSDLQIANFIHDDVIENPDRYKDATSMRAASAILMKATADAVNQLAATKSLASTPLYEAPSEPSMKESKSVLGESETEISLSKSFFLRDGIEFLLSVPPGSFDHVVTDPDYAVDVEVLNSNMGHAGDGVIQESIDSSLDDLARFFPAAFQATRPGAFLVFFYDLDHHEKLQSMSSSAGWLVQRWPLIWKKLDYRSNGAPQANFCKNIEYAMVCRKPGATLTKPQMSSVFECGNEKVVRELNHPFAKPYALWRFIYDAIAIKGQIVCDPFCGSGSAPIAAAQHGLRPVGCEKNPLHFNNLTNNLKAAYKKIVPGNVIFS